MQDTIQSLQNRVYDLALIDHIDNNEYFTNYSINNFRLSTTKLPLSEVVINLDHDLSSLDAIAVELDVFNRIKGNGCFKPASSTLIVSNEAPQLNGDIPTLLTDDEIASYLEDLPPNALFIDKLELTLDVKTKAVERLEKNILNLKELGYGVEFKKVSQPMKVQFRHQYIITSKSGTKVVVLTDSYIGTNNDVKVAINPSKQFDDTLFDTLGCFKSAVGKGYKKLIANANVTRIDYTIDFVNVKVWQLIFLLSNGQYSQTYVDCNGKVETRVEGANNFYIKAYNLTNDRTKKAVSAGDIARVDKFKSLPPIARLEVTLRPQKGSKVKDCSFKNLPEFPAPFDGIKLYNGRKLFQQPELLGKHSHVVLLGLHSLLRQAENTAEYNRIRRQLDKAQIHLSVSTLADQQRCHKLLKGLFLTNDKAKFNQYCKQLSSHVTNCKQVTGVDYV